MGQNNCCIRDKKEGLQESNISSSTINSQPGRLNRFSQGHINVLEKLSLFQPRKNALPVALTHLLQEGCLGLMKSLPRLLEVSSVYAKKGDASHYFEPEQLESRFGLREHVSAGKQFLASELSKVFEKELNHFDSVGVISKEAKNWSLILIFKIGKQTHSFSLKKRNGWEYVLHTLYEVTEEELREEQESIQKEKLQRQQNLKQTKIDENKMSVNTKEDNNNQNQTNPQDKPSIVENRPQLLYSEESTQQTQQDELIPVDVCRQSTRPTYHQQKSSQPLRLRDMVFKGYNCGEICFSPYSLLLEYLNSVSDELLLPLNSPTEPNPKGFMQLIAFTQVKNMQDKDYLNILNPEELQ